MPLEIERKFLVDKEKWNALSKPDGVPFRQSYMLRNEDKAIRIRLTPTHGFLTIKGNNKGATRDEFEYEIPLNDARQLMENYCEGEVAKLRYFIEYEGKMWEVDVFLGKNEGLIVAEIELKDESETFIKPDWIADEVTYDARYLNSNLSLTPYMEW